MTGNLKKPQARSSAPLGCLFMLAFRVMYCRGYQTFVMSFATGSSWRYGAFPKDSTLEDGTCESCQGSSIDDGLPSP